MNEASPPPCATEARSLGLVGFGVVPALFGVVGIAVALVPNAPHNNTDIGTVRDVDELDPIVGGASAVLLSAGLIMIFIGAQQVPAERRRLCLAPWASRKVGGLSLRLDL